MWEWMIKERGVYMMGLLLYTIWEKEKEKKNMFDILLKLFFENVCLSFLFADVSFFWKILIS